VRHNGVGRLWLPLLAVAAVLTLCLRTMGTDAAFAVTTDNPGDSIAAAADWKPPLVSRATACKSQGGMPGYVKQGGTYTMLANVVDDPSSVPPAGVASATGNLTSLSTGVATAALTASSQTVGPPPLAYTHASANQTVNATHAEGNNTISVTATDQASPANSGTTSFTVVVDNTAPTPASATFVNGTGTAGLIDGGDVITYTWTELDGIDPNSISAGWDGTALSVTVLVTNINKNDTVTIRNAANTAQLAALGSVGLGGNWVSGNTTFAATMTWSSTNSDTVVITLGTTAAGTRITNTASTTRNWTPSAAAYDYAANASSTGTVTAAGRNF
jgi:hypothetical protein